MPYLLKVRLLRWEPKRPCIMIMGGLDLWLSVSGGSWRVKARSRGELWKHRGEVEKARRNIGERGSIIRIAPSLCERRFLSSISCEKLDGCANNVAELLRLCVLRQRAAS